MDSRESHGSSAGIASLTSSPQPTTSDSWPPLRGYAYNFVETPPVKYCCGVCSLPLREAHQTGCGHRLCRSCADGLLTETNPQCPECSEPLDQKQVYRDTCCNREILNLHVFCPNEASGCCETMVLHKVLVHLDTCPYELVACHNDACSMHLARLYMPQHHGTCPFRLEFCKFCSAPVPCVQLEEHKQTCPKYLLPCPNNCDEHGIPRNELEKHLVQCALTEQPCSFHRFGCDFKACGKGVSEHEAGSVPQHLLLVLRKHTELQESLGQVQGELEQKASVFEQMQLRLERAESDAEHWGKLVSKNEASLTSTVEKITSQTKRMQVLEKLWESSNGLSTMSLESSRSRECHDNLKGVRQMLEVVKTRLSTLESLQSTVGTMEKTLQTHESLLPVHTQRLADTDLRFQLLETVSCSGRLVWKLTDYAQRKLDATTGITPSLYSQPFYTTTFGYKMCARVYLNGDGVGRGTHLSLFFVVMRGEYDTILSWPFRQRVTLMLLDQGPGRKHLSDTFKPDPTSSSFKRPTSEMNVASGCPMFVSHGVLESRTYLKDDSIFLSIVVDRTGLDDL